MDEYVTPRTRWRSEVAHSPVDTHQDGGNARQARREHPVKALVAQPTDVYDIWMYLAQHRRPAAHKPVVDTTGSVVLMHADELIAIGQWGVEKALQRPDRTAAAGFPERMLDNNGLHLGRTGDVRRFTI